MDTLALLGGKPVIEAPFKPYRSIGEEERLAVDAVMRTGHLSGYVGAWCDAFDGGPVVRDFETRFAAKFKSRHAIAVNSNTSGLIAAMGAAGVSPGDEVIVPPTTMSASAMAPLIYGGIPVFVDIEPDTFCLDVTKVREAITPRTRAILVVNIFGQPAALVELRELADEHGIVLVEDNAQGPLATQAGRYAGTIGHIGVFSLNYHKHIHTGEGGVCCTDDERLARRLRMIRNHAENVTDELADGDLVNLVGFNFRLTELQAAVGIAQLAKVDRVVDGREAIANRFSLELGGFPGVVPPQVRDDCRHVYYVWASRYDERVTGVPRDLFAKALAAEGVPVSVGYVAPLYLLPIFQKRIAIGREGFPFTLTNRSYRKGLCPVAERMHEKEILELHVCSWAFEPTEMQSVIDAFEKVYAHRYALTALAQ
ncbi:MAG: DegT/DnrJ/EryC1/StrS family aminotransferase [Pseudolabrys sp.]|nr:DegT/DnrJ/EryC1/StrS family aminotransferase [Pseudolabrys sp.]